ncbi:MAG: copper chaperone PCu(A)C [Gammaproteobacteria bacterium]|nr:copper chaperone PCu(A)C [Alphaproteobacteria bacterium LMO-S08]WND75142.1 copper chaperone PCu(A)C [Thalassospiraceae bacterium LMO-SO8]
MNPLKLSLLAFIAAFTLLAQAGGASAEDASIVIEKPWARASILQSRPGAAYLTIRNTGTKPDQLLKVTSPAAGMVMIHESSVSEGVAQMQGRDEVTIAPGAEVIFRPGGLHLMLMNLREKLRKGEELILTLEFEHAGKIDIIMPILGLGATGPE